jgi:hypothetical protein
MVQAAKKMLTVVFPAFFLDCNTLEYGADRFSETSVTDYLARILEERQVQLYTTAEVCNHVLKLFVVTKLSIILTHLHC